MTVGEVILSLLQCHTLDNETIIFLKSDEHARFALICTTCLPLSKRNKINPFLDRQIKFFTFLTERENGSKQLHIVI